MKLRFILLVLLFSLVLLYGSCSYAWTIDEFITFNETIANTDTAPSGFKTKANKFLQNAQTLRNDFGNTNYTSFVVNKNAGDLALFCYTSPIEIKTSWSDNNTVYFTQNIQWKDYWIDSNGYGHFGGTAGNQTFAYNTYYGLLNLTTDFNFPSSAWFNNKYVAPVTIYFEPKDDTLIHVYNNGVETNRAYRLKFGYVYPNTTDLGYIRGLSENVYAVEGYFGAAFYFSGDSYVSDGDSNSFNYNLYKGLYTNHLQYDNDTGKVSVTSNRLIENQLYFLTLYYKETFDGDWQSLESDIPFYAIKYNSNAVSGDAISPNLVSPSDISMINALDNYLNNNPNSEYMLGNSYYYSGDWFSGDWLSGDFLGVSYRNYDDWGIGDFVYHTMNSFINVLVDYNDISLNMGIFGMWNSGDFKFPSSPVTAMISLIANGMLVLYAIWFLFRFFNMIGTVDLDGLTSSSDVLDWF